MLKIFCAKIRDHRVQKAISYIFDIYDIIIYNYIHSIFSLILFYLDYKISHIYFH